MQMPKALEISKMPTHSLTSCKSNLSNNAIAPILFIKDERIAAINIIKKRNCISLGLNLLIKFPVTAAKPALADPY